MTSESGFGPVEDTWRQRLTMLPNTVRQALVARQLAEHLPDLPARVLDVGCGQGTQALALAEAGYQVTAVDHSPTMLADAQVALAARAPAVRDCVRLVQGEADALPELLGGERYELVLCHGVLMYLDDPRPVLAAMAAVLAPGGRLSLLVRNAAAAALHHGMGGRWKEARATLGTTAYTNRIGVAARADRLQDLIDQLAAVGLGVPAWYGVNVFTEVAAMESPVPGPGELADVIDCEDQAGRTDPYRAIAAMLHLMAAAPA